MDYGCDLIIFNYRRVTPEKTYNNPPLFENGSLFDRWNKNEIFEKIITGSELNNIWIKAVKRNLVDTSDYTRYKFIKNAEDLLLSLPLLYNANRILYLDKVMYNYRMNLASITHKFNIRMIKDITIVRGKVLKYMRRLGMMKEPYLKLFYRYYMSGVMNYLSDLSVSDMNIIRKKKIMGKIQNFRLYKKALPYVYEWDFSEDDRIRFYLFKNEFYRLYILYENTVRFIKSHI
jgi:hypothetical protein